MTQEEIIEMARQAGMHKGEFGWTTGDDPNCLYPECVYTENLEAFAKLVAAKEREACAKVCEDLDSNEWRERSWDEATLDCAAAIRARGLK